MKFSVIFFILFISVALLELASHLFQNVQLHLFVKPLLMPLLAAYFTTTSLKAFKLAKGVLIALFFSFLGDTFLLFDGKADIFFILGLSMFLLAHIFYVIFFYKQAKDILVFKKNLILILILGYGVSLIYYLFPHLGEMLVPVVVYALVIMTMLIFATNLLLNSIKGAKFIWIGALFFVISDSLIAIDKFAIKIWQAQFLIMITYIFAQWAIIEGVIRLLQNKNIVLENK
ncbi:MAG: lysoplasmalogenase [Raineya sp.]|jgi:uncharacterized membrane protein YhhN|nr:lysoplasmalogenase [Raineya sp.]